MMEIIPTNTCPPDLPELSRRSESFSKFAATVHLDIADAKFAPTISWPYQDGEWSELESMADRGNALPYLEKLAYEAHLMIEKPFEIGGLLARAGCMRIVAHVEAFGSADEAKRTFDSWRENGAKEIGIAVLAATPLEALDEYIYLCESVTLMTIATIGAQGIPFDERGYGRVADLHARYPDLVIEVDGGVGKEQIATLARAGASRFSVGSAISKSPDPAQTHRELLELAQKAL